MEPNKRPHELDALLRDHGGLEGLGREIGQGDPAADQQAQLAGAVNPAQRMIGWLLRQDAASVFFVVIAAVLLAWFVRTLL
jgi:hypothetical protein